MASAAKPRDTWWDAVFQGETTASARRQGGKAMKGGLGRGLRFGFLDVAARFGAPQTRAARWVAMDALHELTSAKRQTGLRVDH